MDVFMVECILDRVKKWQNYRSETGMKATFERRATKHVARYIAE